MNRSTARALFLDAYSQVLDNTVFRLLVLSSIVVVAPAFLVGFRQDGIHILFGWKFISYSSFLGEFNNQLPHVQDVHVWLIQSLQRFLVETLAGSLGILICITATAFFVPRMLEKGAADTLFTKPISRPVLLCARYVAGLIFVGALSFVVVLGIHLGLLLVSGYSDPAFLWCTLTLVYIYALVQTVSIAVGVFTRNSVAAILCTVFFFLFNGCVHSMWMNREWVTERRSADLEDDPKEVVRDLETGLPILRVIRLTLEGLHYVLPKTGDGDVITRKLRTVVVGRTTVLSDGAGKLAVEANPEGFELRGPKGDVDLLRSPATWVSKGQDGAETSRITLLRRSRIVERPAASGRPEDKPRKTHQSAAQAALDFQKSLEGRADVVGPTDRQHEPAVDISYEHVRWTESAADGKVRRDRAFFSVDDWMYEVDVATPAVAAEVAPEVTGAPTKLDRFMGSLHTTRDDAAFLGSDKWYEVRFGWTSPLKFNAFFSIGSSLAFAVLVLAVAAWRLSRIDF